MPDRLPPIFSKVRFSIPKDDLPPVVIRCTAEQMQAAKEAVAQAAPDDTDYFVFAHCWMEGPLWGLLAYCPDERVVRIAAWDKAGRLQCRSTFDTTDTAPGKGRFRDPELIARAAYFQLAYTVDWFANRPAEVSVNTLTRNHPAAWQRQGDTMRFAALDDLRSAAGQHRQRGYEPPQEPSGIRKREHDVRGHWRTYPSGVRVWVREHRRGDPELGRVTRVIGAARGGGEMRA